LSNAPSVVTTVEFKDGKRVSAGSDGAASVVTTVEFKLFILGTTVTSPPSSVVTTVEFKSVSSIKYIGC
ncbi:hypothetical protein, partial [Veillonella magna]|uniref:hypothetical protein n=1 Tax=Veillonella magna TaxID=464322 RepID=UPI00195FAB51